MKKTKMVLPTNCELVTEEASKELYGGFPAWVLALQAIMYAHGYPAAGAYAKKIWPNGIPSYAKHVLANLVPDPVAWWRFMQGYDAA